LLQIVKWGAPEWYFSPLPSSSGINAELGEIDGEIFPTFLASSSWKIEAEAVEKPMQQYEKNGVVSNGILISAFFQVQDLLGCGF
jgi:hypothetical protein